MVIVVFLLAAALVLGVWIGYARDGGTGGGTLARIGAGVAVPVATLVVLYRGLPSNADLIGSDAAAIGAFIDGVGQLATMVFVTPLALAAYLAGLVGGTSLRARHKERSQ